MRLKPAPRTYDAADQAALREAIRRSAEESLKRGQDIELVGGARLILTAPAGQQYALAVNDHGQLGLIDGAGASLAGGCVVPEAFGAAGDGTANDTAALAAALGSGRDVQLTQGKTYRFDADLDLVTDHQRLTGPGVLKPDGAVGVRVTSGAVGVVIDGVRFDSASHSGVAITVDGAHRTTIANVLLIDVEDGFLVQGANTTVVRNLWGVCRGFGVKWYGTTLLRSDILAMSDVILDVGDAEYGVDWDGNCHSAMFRSVGVIGGKGFIVRNSFGGTAPAIGRFVDCESDYSLADSFRIEAGSDYDLVACYALGEEGSGLYVGAAINDYEVRVSGGKFRGHARYGIEAAGGVVLSAGNLDLSDNDLGETLGNVWTRSQRFTVDPQLYLTLSAGNPLLGFDAGDYLAYDRANDVCSVIVGGTAELSIAAGGLTIAAPTLMSTTVAFTNGAGAAAGTLTNAPAAGNPSKWIPIVDNGTTRYIPAW